MFLDRWGRRGMARRCRRRGVQRRLGARRPRAAGRADRRGCAGWPTALVWVNPHRGKAGYLPVQAGIVAVLPHVDDFVAGHSLAAFEELLEVVAVRDVLDAI